MHSFAYTFIVLGVALICVRESAATRCGHNLKRQGVPRIEEIPCPVNGTALNGTSVFCGMLVVPLRSRIYPRRTIKLPMLRICPNSPRHLNRRTTPVLHVHGGPGATVLKDFDSNANSHFFDISIRSGREVVLFDERGSVITKPEVNCSEPFPLTSKCVQEIRDKGIDLSAYNTRNNAKDIDDLRKAIRARKLNVYGNSYGTILSQAYARAFRSRIRSIVLTGATWPSLDLFMQNSPKSFELVVGRAILDCKRDFNCSRRYPNLQNDFDKLLDLPLGKKRSPLAVPDLFPVTRRGVLTLLSYVIRTLSITESTSLTPLHISTYAQYIRNPDMNSTAGLILRQLNSLGLDFSTAVAPLINLIVLQTVNCYDNRGLLSDLIEERVNGGLKSREALTLSTPKERRAVCKLLPPLNPPINTRFYRHNIPTLILSGTYDVQTPTEASRMIVRELRNARLVEFSGIGHTPLYDSDCAVQMYVKFLGLPNGKRFKPLPCIREVKPKFIIEI